jgi:hypothetical protein
MLIVIGVNYCGDAANLFSDSYENEVASEIVEGNNVTNILNCDERNLQRLIIKKLDYRPDIVVLGSSRIMEITESMFKDSSLINNGVSGASIEDLLAIVELYAEKKWLPKKIIIGLDPWTLNKNNEQVRWRTLEKEYLLFLRRIKVDQMIFLKLDLGRHKNNIKSLFKFYELISPSYFKSSLKVILFQGKRLKITQETINDTFTRRSDNSISYDVKYRSASIEEIDKKVSEYIKGNLYSVRNFSELDKAIQYQLEYMIKYLQSKNVEIDFVLTPYHPIVYKLVSKEPFSKVLDSEKYLLQLASRYHIEVFGSFNPEVYNLNKHSFYDGMHSNSSAVNLILKYNRTNNARIF